MLYDSDDLNKYISHIVYTIKCTQDYDQKNLIKKELNDLFSNILRKFNDNTTSYEKTSQAIQVEVYNTIKNVENKFQEIHKRILNNVDFELIKDNPKAWGIQNMDTKLLKEDDSFSINNNLKNISENFDIDIDNFDKSLSLTLSELAPINATLKQLERIINNERVKTHYNYLSGKEITDKRELLERNSINMIELENNISQKKEFEELDDLLRHKNSLTFRDSILDFNNGIYIQGFNDYRIKRLPNFNIDLNLDNPFVYFFNILAEILEIKIDLDIITLLDNIPESFDKINNFVNNIVNNVDKIKRNNTIQGEFNNEGFLFLLLTMVINQEDINTINVNVLEYNRINNIDFRLLCHFNEVIKTFKDSNIILLSCINGYFRIICKQCNTENNNFSYYNKVLFDSLKEWQLSNDLNMVKTTGFNLLKLRNFKTNDLNKMVKLFLNNNFKNPDEISDYNLIEKMIINIPKKLSIDQILSELKSIVITEFENNMLKQLESFIRMNTRKGCHESEINQIELLINMIKYYFFNHTSNSNVKSKSNLHILINFIRKNQTVFSFNNIENISLFSEEEERRDNSNNYSLIALTVSQILGEVMVLF